MTITSSIWMSSLIRYSSCHDRKASEIFGRRRSRSVAIPRRIPPLTTGRCRIPSDFIRPNASFTEASGAIVTTSLVIHFSLSWLPLVAPASLREVTRGGKGSV